MKQKMFVICTSIAALHLGIGGVLMLSGCTGVQEDEPMPKNAFITKQQDEQKTEVQKPEVQQAQPETVVDVPVVEDPVEIPEPVIEKPIEKPVEKPVRKVEKPITKAPVAKKTVRDNDIEYIIKKGDTYSKISLEFGVPLKDLMAYNPYPEKRLIPGRKIMIPATGKKITKKAFTPSVKVQKNYEAIPADGIYVVKKNDSYSRIASRFGLRASDIAEYNNLPLTKAIQPGQKLRLPPRRVTAPKKTNGKAAVKNTAKPQAKKAQPAAEPVKKPAEKPASEDNLEDVPAPSLDNIDIPNAGISGSAPAVAVAEVMTEDTTVAKLADEYARSEQDIRKQNPHLSADGSIKRGTKVVL